MTNLAIVSREAIKELRAIRDNLPKEPQWNDIAQRLANVENSLVRAEVPRPVKVASNGRDRFHARRAAGTDFDVFTGE
jgi:hypothetical protein